MDGRARLDLVSRWISTRLSTMLSGRWQRPFARCGTGFTPRRSLIDRPAAYADKDHPEQTVQIKELLDLDHWRMACERSWTWPRISRGDTFCCKIQRHEPTQGEPICTRAARRCSLHEVDRRQSSAPYLREGAERCPAVDRTRSQGRRSCLETPRRQERPLDKVKRTDRSDPLRPVASCWGKVLLEGEFP